MQLIRLEREAKSSLSDLQDSLTVEYGRRPGATFAYKMMQYVLPPIPSRYLLKNRLRIG